MSWLRFTGLDRFSPFTRSPPQGSATVSDADFSYITNDDLKRHVAQSRTEEQEGDKRDTDVLRVRERRDVHNLHFAAYSIGRGELKVGDVREATAKKLGVKSKRVELHFKARKLSDDAQRCIDVGLKDGSELLGTVDDAASSESDLSEEDANGREVRSSTKKKRKNRSSKNKRKKQATETAATSEVLDVPPQQQRIASPARPLDPLKLGTPQEKLTALFAILHSFEQDVQAFLKNPPAEASKREFEHKRLSETILTQVLLKTDAVETEGDADARARRKQLVKETQDVLRSLDETSQTAR